MAKTHFSGPLRIGDGASSSTYTVLEDGNANEILDYTVTAAAVNHIRTTNAATGNAPSVSAVGDDAKIDLQVTPKGTGIVALDTRSTGTVASGSATINAQRGEIIWPTLTTGIQGLTATDFVNNKLTTSSNLIFMNATTNISGDNQIVGAVFKAFIRVAGSARLTIENHGTGALSGTARVAFLVV